MSNKASITNSISSRIKLFITRHLNNQNTQQYITLGLSFISEYLSISIANLAIWFIPQPQSYSYDILLYLMLQNWYDIIIILSNLTTWFCFTMLYIFEIYREIWLIRHFDYSARYNSMNLTKYKNTYPEVFTYLATINWFYYKIYRYIRFLVIYNIVITFVLIIKYNYLDYKTITTLFTNFWICYKKMQNGITIARDSSKKNLGYSYFNTQNISFNRIDPRIKHHESNSRFPTPNHSRINSSIDLRSYSPSGVNNKDNNRDNNRDNNHDFEIEKENYNKNKLKSGYVSRRNSISGSNPDSLSASINYSNQHNNNIQISIENTDNIDNNIREIDLMQDLDPDYIL